MSDTRQQRLAPTWVCRDYYRDALASAFNTGWREGEKAATDRIVAKLTSRRATLRITGGRLHAADAIDQLLAEVTGEVDAYPWEYRDSLAVAALAWHDAQNDMTQDRGEAHRMLMQACSDYRREHGIGTEGELR